MSATFLKCSNFEIILQQFSLLTYKSATLVNTHTTTYAAVICMYAALMYVSVLNSDALLCVNSEKCCSLRSNT